MHGKVIVPTSFDLANGITLLYTPIIYSPGQIERCRGKVSIKQSRLSPAG
jgi:hypothetical protein